MFFIFNVCFVNPSRGYFLHECWCEGIYRYVVQDISSKKYLNDSIKNLNREFGASRLLLILNDNVKYLLSKPL